MWIPVPKLMWQLVYLLAISLSFHVRESLLFSGTDLSFSYILRVETVNKTTISGFLRSLLLVRLCSSYTKHICDAIIHIIQKNTMVHDFIVSKYELAPANTTLLLRVFSFLPFITVTADHRLLLLLSYHIPTLRIYTTAKKILLYVSFRDKNKVDTIYPISHLTKHSLHSHSINWHKKVSLWQWNVYAVWVIPSNYWFIS